MNRHIFSALALAFTLLLLSTSARAQGAPRAATAPDQSTVKVTSITLNKSCAVENDCVDAVWSAQSTLPASQLHFVVNGRVEYTESGSSVRNNTNFPFSQKQAKLSFFHRGSGGVKLATVTVMLIHTPPGQSPKQVAATTLTQNF